VQPVSICFDVSGDMFFLVRCGLGPKRLIGKIWWLMGSREVALTPLKLLCEREQVGKKVAGGFVREKEER
jgi:hypothetical protein